jgi:hypothetical protein
VKKPMANEEWVAAYQAGDIGGLEEVFRNVEGLIRHQAKKLCRNDSLLEDLPLARYVQLRKIGKAVSANEKEQDQLAEICQVLGVSLRVAQALRKEYLSFRSDPIPLKDLELVIGDFTSDPAYMYE